jgi:hypothetical protein
VRLPDRDRSTALLIGASDFDMPRLNAIRDALTDPEYGGFTPERCHVTDLQNGERKLASVPRPGTLLAGAEPRAPRPAGGRVHCPLRTCWRPGPVSIQ